MRLYGGWQFFGAALIFVHFLFPFFVMLSRNLKREGRRIIKVVYLLLLMRLIDLVWFTAPNFYPGEGLSKFGVQDGIMYVLAPLRLGASGCGPSLPG